MIIYSITPGPARLPKWEEIVTGLLQGLLGRGCAGSRAVEEIGSARGTVGLLGGWGRDAE